MPIQLDDIDKKLAERVKNAIKKAYDSAHAPSAVVKSIISFAMRYRNKGRDLAKKRHPFRGTCEASGESLADEDKCLDELEPEKGYAGKIRWVCPKANNSGRRSCGGC